MLVIISSGLIIFLTIFIMYTRSTYYDENIFYFMFILTSIAIIGGVLLLKDQVFGGILAVFCGGIEAGLFFVTLLFSSSSNPNTDVFSVGLVLSGVIAVGGLIGLITDPDLLKRKGKVLRDFLIANTEGIFKHYKVKKITFWRIYSEGYGLLVNFYQGVNESDIIELITSLQINFYEKIYLISKTGLIQSTPAKNKYYIYNIENNSLQINEESIEPK